MNTLHDMDHTTAPTTARDYTYVDTDTDLAALVARINTARHATPNFRCCLDTEADSLHHFQEKLCLIQLAFADEFVLIDPLAIKDMSAFIAAIDAGDVWFHGADYDLTLLRKTYGWSPRVMRDTQIAARLAGSRAFGLAALIEAHFGKALSKASQKADWSRRPLPDTMLNYAVDDVRYLLTLADILQDQLAAKGRTDWFIESCVDLQKDVANRSGLRKEDPWRVQGAGRLQPKGLAVLKAMWEWRETAAEERDYPCFRVMSNKQMIEIVTHFEATDEPLYPPAGWRPRWKKEFCEAIQIVVDAEPSTWPRRIKPQSSRLSDTARDQVDRLCQARDAIGKDLDIEGSLIGSRGTLEVVAAKAEGIQELLTWQQTLLATPLAEARAALGFTV
jgi:ribonuclease D